MLFSISCQSLKKDLRDVNKGEWEGRVLIKDKIKSKSYIAILNTYAVYNKKFRMDLISPIGGHLGSFLFARNNITILDVPQKKVYKGVANFRSLSKLINIPLHPRHFYAIFFERPITGKYWRCNKKNGLVVKCKNKPVGITIKWDRRLDNKTTIMISHKLGSMQINIKKFKEQFDEQKKLTLKIPKSYTVIGI